jgi:hypothetical protein
MDSPAFCGSIRRAGKRIRDGINRDCVRRLPRSMRFFGAVQTCGEIFASNLGAEIEIRFGDIDFMYFLIFDPEITIMSQC